MIAYIVSGYRSIRDDHDGKLLNIAEFASTVYAESAEDAVEAWLDNYDGCGVTFTDIQEAE